MQTETNINSIPSPTPDLQSLAEPNLNEQGPTLNPSSSEVLLTNEDQRPTLNHGISLPPGWPLTTEPWPHPVDARHLLDELRMILTRFVVLPTWAAETLSLWILHTYAFELRDVSAYLGVESPARRCGKTTLLTILCQLVNRPVVAANVSSPSLFRAIADLRPTLMIDEADRFLKGKHDLQGILNSGYSRKTAFVLRVASHRSCPSAPGATTRQSATSRRLAFFSCWCPKVISQIGRLPDTLADRCIVLRMQRKTPHEKCERLRNLETVTLRRQCARFVLDHRDAIANAQPELPEALNDRAADIWEPLFALADLAGNPWPELARRAAISLSASAQEGTPLGSLLFDIFVLIARLPAERIFSRALVKGLNDLRDRPWMEMTKCHDITEAWLSQLLRPYGIRPRTMRIGETQAKGYFKEDCLEALRRYCPRSEFEALIAESNPPGPSTGDNGKSGASLSPDS